MKDEALFYFETKEVWYLFMVERNFNNIDHLSIFSSEDDLLKACIDRGWRKPSRLISVDDLVCKLTK